MDKIVRQIKKKIKEYSQDCHDWQVVGEEDFNKLALAIKNYIFDSKPKERDIVYPHEKIMVNNYNQALEDWQDNLEKENK